MAKSWSRGAALSALLSAWVKETSAFRVGQEVCVSGFVTCLNCNAGAMSPYNTQYNMFQSAFHPEDHNLACLVKSESCIGDGYEILTRYAIDSVENKDESNEVFCRSFKLDSNSSDFLAAAGSAYYHADNGVVRIGGFPVSFAGQIADVGDSYSSLVTVTLDTDTLSLSAGGCANEDVPHYCISRSGSYQFTAYQSPSPTKSSPTSKSPTKSPVSPLPTKSPLVSPSDAFVDSTTDSQAAATTNDAQTILQSSDAVTTTESGDATSDRPSVIISSETVSLDFTTDLFPTSAPDSSDPPTSANITNVAVSISAQQSATNDDNESDDKVDIIIGDVLQVDSSQEPTYMDKEMEIKELFKNHGKLAGASWGILVPLAMSAAWFRESFPMVKSNGSTSCVSRLCNQAWLVIHASMAVVAAVATSASVYFVVKALSLEGGYEYATRFSSPHQYMGIFLLIGAWVQVLGGIFRPKNKLTGHTKMQSGSGDEENTVEHDNDDSSDSATVSSTHTMKQGAIIHKWRRSANPSGDTEVECDEETVATVAPKSTGRKVWDYGHRLMAMILVICGFWQLFSGLEEYQERYGDDSYLVTACMVWVGVFWSVTFLLTCFYKKF
jgi:hypothetical protein